ncbi:hypothetical protein ACX1N0_13635 [Acinetobacter sp. ANC 4635]|uniref:hypothetical protein n=1 Tax=Acinetobacter sp. ANC 4635 TaxID=2529846 RepID=UPI0013F1627F|nr:hypothetical protein [Acinetobacter sp. ANC 4635]
MDSFQFPNWLEQDRPRAVKIKSNGLHLSKTIQIMSEAKNAMIDLHGAELI